MRSSLVFLFLLGLAAVATAKDWPKDFIVAEGSTSPDGKLGILIPATGSDEINDDTDEQVNYLANLASHQILGKIENANLYEQETHTNLSTHWYAGSSVCVLEYNTRYGIYSLSVLVFAPDRKSFRQLNAGKKAQADLDASIVQQSGDSDTSGEAVCYLRPGKDHQILFRIPATTNPQQLQDEKSWCALFQGTFDTTTGKWLVTDIRPIDGALYPKLDTAYVDGEDDATLWNTEQEKAAQKDQDLNDIYAVVQAVLPPAKFEEVKASEIAWLKKVGRTKTPAARMAMTEARIDVLKDLLW